MICPFCGYEIPGSRPRSTGKYSQNHRLNGFIAQVCHAKGGDFDMIKCEVKRRAIELGFPPYREVRIGGQLYAIFKSEADCTMRECGYLIATVEQLAAEEGVHLVEVDDT